MPTWSFCSSFSLCWVSRVPALSVFYSILAFCGPSFLSFVFSQKHTLWAQNRHQQMLNCCSSTLLIQYPIPQPAPETGFLCVCVCVWVCVCLQLYPYAHVWAAEKCTPPAPPWDIHGKFLEPVNVTLIGKRAVADVIKLRNLRWGDDYPDRP